MARMREVNIFQPRVIYFSNKRRCAVGRSVVHNNMLQAGHRLLQYRGNGFFKECPTVMRYGNNAEHASGGLFLQIEAGDGGIGGEYRHGHFIKLQKPVKKGMDKKSDQAGKEI